MVVTIIPGFFLYSTAITLYLVVLVAFPATLRGTGAGVAVGVSRLGAVFGSYLSGVVLIGTGWPRVHYFLVMVLPVILVEVLLRALQPPATITARQLFSETCYAHHS